MSGTHIVDGPGVGRVTGRHYSQHKTAENVLRKVGVKLKVHGLGKQYRANQGSFLCIETWEPETIVSPRPPKGLIHYPVLLCFHQ